MIDCKENGDGSFTISWDENDPEESAFNDWTKQDFIEVLRCLAEEENAMQKSYSKNSEESGEESRETYYNSQSEGKEIDQYIEETNKETFGN